MYGDFRISMHDASPPDLIWYDPFSYKVDAELWSITVFRELLACCVDKETRLFTYSASTAVRAAMLLAGWYVGPGIGSGPKAETIATIIKLLCSCPLNHCSGRWRAFE
jgi:queuine tRNA-ribosyltransferase